MADETQKDPSSQRAFDLRLGAEGLRPVVVRQLLEAKQAYNGADFTINGSKVLGIETVATVVSVRLGNPVGFYLEDGSRGRIRATQWTSDTGDIESENPIEQTYVHVIGNLHRYKGRNSLNVRYRRLVVDYHEIYYHLLMTMKTTIELKPPPPENLHTTIPEVLLVNSNGPESPDTSHLPSPSPLLGDAMLHDNATSDNLVDPNDQAKNVKGKGKEIDYDTILPRDMPSTSISSPTNSFRSAFSSPSHLSTFHDDLSSSLPDHIIGSSSANPRREVSSEFTIIEREDQDPWSSTKPRRDPYSHLSALQREIIRYIGESDPQPMPLYNWPNLRDNNVTSKGVHVARIASHINICMPSESEDAIIDATDTLVDQGYICTPMGSCFLRLSGT